MLASPRPASGQEWAGDGSGFEITHLSQERSPFPPWFHTVSTSLLVTKQNTELEEMGWMNRKGAQPPCPKLKGKVSRTWVPDFGFNSWQSFLAARCCSKTIIKWCLNPWVDKGTAEDGASIPNTSRSPGAPPEACQAEAFALWSRRRPPASVSGCRGLWTARDGAAVASVAVNNRLQTKNYLQPHLIQSRCFPESALAWCRGYSHPGRLGSGSGSECLKINDQGQFFPGQSIHPAPSPWRQMAEL